MLALFHTMYSKQHYPTQYTAVQLSRSSIQYTVLADSSHTRTIPCSMQQTALFHTVYSCPSLTLAVLHMTHTCQLSCSSIQHTILADSSYTRTIPYSIQQTALFHAVYSCQLSRSHYPTCHTTWQLSHSHTTYSRQHYSIQYTAVQLSHSQCFMHIQLPALMLAHCPIQRTAASSHARTIQYSMLADSSHTRTVACSI